MSRDYLSIFLSFLLKFSIFSVLFIFLGITLFIFIKGIMHINLGLFEWEYNSTNVSLMPALINTINMVICSLIIAMPLGIFGAIYLNEYSKTDSKILSLIRITSDTLVGIPSIVYGLFGYLAFVIYFGFKIER